MKKIKIIAMDFDGTLLTSDKKITERTKKTIINLKNKSYIIVGVTARNLLSARSVLDVNLFDYIILNNGSNIYYVKEDRIENISSMENETVEKIYNLFSNHAYQIDFCTPYMYLIKAKEKNDNRSVVKYIDDLGDVDSSVSRMNIFFENEKDLEANRHLLEKEFNNINVVKMVDTDDKNSRMWLTVNPKNANKLTTLKKICNDLKKSIEEVIFFGDGENDLVLIENAGIGVAMANAIEIVKEKATFVTSSNDNDGIAEYLEKNI